jgi:hypothetical protein
MRFVHKPIITFLFLLALFVGLTACSQAFASEAAIEEQWAQSAHNDTESASFTSWDDEEPPEIPVDCAKCHSTLGYLDFLGANGTIPGQINHPAPIGTTVECDACHDSAAEARRYVIMPSNAVVTKVGQQANCMECNQGRASSKQLDEQLEGFPQDTVNLDLRLPNIHNNAAAATFYGSIAAGGGEYLDQEYVGKFYHGFDTCITCHDPHTLQVEVDKCSACHFGASTIEGVRNIRLSKIDYDGDGDISEGLSGEIETLQEKLLVMIRLSAATTEGAGLIAYNGNFVNENEETYDTWTPRVLRAAYNYQYAVKDPGSYSHNPKYIMQLLYDSIDDLGGDIRGMNRP